MMDRPTEQKRSLVRGVRNVSGTICLFLCTLFVVLWARSYFTRDIVHWHLGGGTLVFKVVSHLGDLTLVKFPAWSTDFKTSWGMNTANDPERSPPLDEWHKHAPAFGFAFRQASIPQGKNNVLFVSVPHWFFALLAAMLVAILKTKPRRRFSLLNLFVLITCVAIVLGALAGVDRATKANSRSSNSPTILPDSNDVDPLA